MVKENGFSKIGWCAPFVRNASYNQLEFIIIGNWGQWSNWSSCNVLSGIGFNNRSRLCNKTNTFEWCFGNITEVLFCYSNETCKGIIMPNNNE